MLGNLAPEFKLPSFDGPSFSLSGLRGKPVMLNFWATWCDACRFEMPLLQQVQEKWSERGLVLLAIDIGEKPEQVRNFMQSQRLSLTVLLDSQGEVANRYGIRYLPTTFFINGDGIIKEIRIGAFPSTSAIENSLRKIMP